MAKPDKINASWASEVPGLADPAELEPDAAHIEPDSAAKKLAAGVRRVAPLGTTH